MCAPACVRARGAERLRAPRARLSLQADNTPLEADYSVFRSFTNHGRARGGLSWGVIEPDSEELSEELLEAYYKLVRRGNVTAFSKNELAHPINFYEQSDVCKHCGAERFRTSKMSQCCHDGKLKFNNQQCNGLPSALLTLISSGAGLSKQSRCANDLFRFAQFALPKGTHRIPDSFQHLKVRWFPIVRACVRVCACACMRACVRVRVRTCVRAYHAHSVWCR